jgi:hypothetical protein
MARITTTIWLVGFWRYHRTIYLGNNHTLEGNSLMDIFEEIKEAVMQATPGESTRNYYRNQGIEAERTRIIIRLDLFHEENHENWEEGTCDCNELIQLVGNNA